MNFGDSLIRYIKTLYYNLKCCVKNNNWITENYNKTRGIRQGCPMSCLIFFIAVENLDTRKRNNVKK